jgi:hypothetical protein
MYVLLSNLLRIYDSSSVSCILVDQSFSLSRERGEKEKAGRSISLSRAAAAELRDTVRGTRTVKDNRMSAMGCLSR